MNPEIPHAVNKTISHVKARKCAHYDLIVPTIMQTAIGADRNEGAWLILQSRNLGYEFAIGPAEEANGDMKLLSRNVNLCDRTPRHGPYELQKANLSLPWCAQRDRTYSPKPATRHLP